MEKLNIFGEKICVRKGITGLQEYFNFFHIKRFYFLNNETFLKY